MTTSMRHVLMVSPHFPPDSSAASHRLRLLGPYLPSAGWTPTIVTVDPSAYEGRLDAGLESLVPPTVDVVRAHAWPARWTRPVGFGDLGLRAWTGLRRSCRRLLATRQFDALFITVYPVYPALLGPALKRRFGVPFVLDYQDPWVGEWGKSVGSASGGGVDWKSRASRQLGLWLEPRVVAAADALVAVSQGTIDGVVSRIPAAAQVPHGIIPVGFDGADFDRLDGRRPSSTLVDFNDGNVHLCYVGTLLPTGDATMRLLLRALARARSLDDEARRLRLHFFGTSNQSAADRYRVMPAAAELGVAEVVTEAPGRLDYMDALAVLVSASGILLLGSSDRHYTASKLYPALMARRPILAMFHCESSVVSILRDIAREPTVSVVTYEGGERPQTTVDEVARSLIARARHSRYEPADVDMKRAAAFSAPRLAQDLAAVLDKVAA